MILRINRTGWTPEEREQYDALLAEVVAGTTKTSDRLNHFERLLNDAIQAHRPWARDVERSCIRNGLAKEIKNYQDRNRAMVSHDGQVLNLPRVQGTVTRDEDGAVYHQRELIELWSWQQIADKRVEALKGRRTYNQKIAHYDRLLALRDMCPDSATPAEAAEQLGLNLDEFLGLEAAA